jgi:hypothetical protein
MLGGYIPNILDLETSNHPEEFPNVTLSGRDGVLIIGDDSVVNISNRVYLETLGTIKIALEGS